MQLLRPSKRSFKLFLVPTKQTEAVDDYLKAILELSGPQETRVSSNALAARLGVRAASVTGMLQKLATRRPSLVLYEKHHGVRLTVAGKRRAWEIVRHHRLLELFLHDVLKYSWDEVHEEAERLEHFISERFEDRVAAILGDPQIDPHGHMIPQRLGAVSFQKEAPLLEWALGAPAIISSVVPYSWSRPLRNEPEPPKTCAIRYGAPASSFAKAPALNISAVNVSSPVRSPG